MERQLGPDPRLEPHAKAHDYMVEITRYWRITVTAHDEDDAEAEAKRTIDDYRPDEEEIYVMDDLGEAEKDQD